MARIYAPAQIVRDAQEHGVEVRPICINASRWDCTLEPVDNERFAVRLGLRMVRGLANTDAAAILTARTGRRFADVDDVWRRSDAKVSALERLAEADAFQASLGLARREASWAIKALRDNPRVHATTGRVVDEAFAEEKPTLLLLPLIPFGAVLKLDRRISCEGMVSVGGNYYSFPDATRRRLVEVHSMADEIQIFEDDRLIARHPLLAGRRQRSLLKGHRRSTRQQDLATVPAALGGERVVRRPLAVYEAIGRRLATATGAL